MTETTIDLNERIARLEAIVSSIPKHETAGLQEKAMHEALRRLEAIEQRIGNRDALIARQAADAAIAAVTDKLKSASQSQIKAVGEVLADMRKETNATISGTASDIRKELHAIDALNADSHSRAAATVLSAVSKLSPSFRT